VFVTAEQKSLHCTCSDSYTKPRMVKFELNDKFKIWGT
jgi:hypothetical protein